MPGIPVSFALRKFAPLALVFGAASLCPAQQYQQTNLVSDQSGVAAQTDPNLVNPWGLSRSSGSPWWASDNGTGLSTLYDGSGNAKSLVVTVPAGNPNVSSMGTPTGTLFNGTSGFALASGKPALFLFVTQDGTISGWNPGVNATSAVIEVNTWGASAFTGAAFATLPIPNGSQSTFMYVADFRKRRIQVYDSSFHHVSLMEELFDDDSLPRGFAPFNIQNIGGELYVAYARQDADKNNATGGAGMGFVDVFSPFGFFHRRLESGWWMNAPWGMAMAPGDFGIYSHDLLVGQFGSGNIAVFDPVTGAFKDLLRDANNNPITIGGLWDISFGSGAAASGSATALYFSAGPDGGTHGLFGDITPIQNTLGNAQ